MTVKLITAGLVLIIAGFAIFTLRDARDGFKVMKGNIRHKMSSWREKRKYEPVEKPEILLQWGTSKKKVPVELHRSFGLREPIRYVIGSPDGKADIPINYPGLMPKHAVIELIEEDDKIYYVFRNCSGRANAFKRYYRNTWITMRRGEEVELNPNVEGEVFTFGPNKKTALKIIITVPGNWDPSNSTRRWAKNKKKCSEAVYDEDMYEELDDEDLDEEEVEDEDFDEDEFEDDDSDNEDSDDEAFDEDDFDDGDEEIFTGTYDYLDL